MSYIIAKRYAQALLDVSNSKKAEDSVFRDLQKIGKTIEASSEFKYFMSNPGIPIGKRSIILKELFEKSVSKLTLDFICLVNQKNRLPFLGDICRMFEQLYLDQKGIVRVKITSNISLKKTHIDGIIKQLKSRLNKEIEPEVYDDPSMLGGFKIREGDTIYDFSLRAQLEQFRKNLIKA